VSFAFDKSPSTLTLNMTNGNGDPIPSIPAGTPACTCRLSYQVLSVSGGVCNGMHDVSFSLRSSEPGTVLLCRKNGPLAEVDPVNEWKSCGDLNYRGGTSTFVPDLRNNVVFNQPLQTVWTLSSLAYSNSFDDYEIGLRDIDVGGNITPATFRFRVQSATCPNRTTYCPNATSAGTGIFFRPRDSCDIDDCFPGQHSWCDPAVAAVVCIGRTFPDDCRIAGACNGRRNCGPLPPNSCTFTQGYWKTHANQWPQSARDNGLKIGNVTYTKTQLLAVFNRLPQGNGLLILAHQLIAAKLNILKGADASVILASIAKADVLIGNRVIPPIGTGNLSSASTSALTAALTSYNEGSTGPGHCP
jgi:hypothetical protein